MGAKSVCVFVCVWIYIYIYYKCKFAELLKELGAKSEYVYVCLSIFDTFTYLYVHMYLCLCTSCIYVYAHVYAHVFMFMHMFMHMYLCLCTCLCTCIYVYAHVYAHQLRGSRREMPQISRYRCIHTHVHPILANILSIFCQFFVNIWYWHAILHGVSTLCRLPKLLGLFSKKNPIIVGLFGKRNLVIWRSIKIYHPTHRNTRNERWGAGVETQKNVRGVFKGWGRVPFNETYAPSLSTIYDEA